MNGKDRLLAAFDFRLPDVVPVAPCYPNIFLRRFEKQAYIDHYRDRLRDGHEYRLSPEEDNDALMESKVASLRAWGKMPDWIGVSKGPAAEFQARSVIRVDGGTVYLVDDATGDRIDLSELARGGSNTLMHGKISDISASAVLTGKEVEQRVPIVGRTALLATGAYEVARRLTQRYRDQFFIHSVLSTPFASAKYVTGFYSLMIMMKENRELLKSIIDRCLQTALQQLEVWAELGVHGVWLQETLSSADLISHQAYDEFVFPGTSALVRRCQKLGMKAIHYPTGDVMPRLPRLVEMAPDAIAVEESRKNFVLDIAAIRAAVGGQVCLFGNVDAHGVLELGDGELYRNEIKRQLDGGRAARGGFVMGIGSPITPGTPPEKVASFISLCREIGRYPLGPISG